MEKSQVGAADPQLMMFKDLTKDWDFKLVRSPSMGKAGQVANLAAKFGGQVKKKLLAHQKAKSRQEVKAEPSKSRQEVKAEPSIAMEQKKEEQEAQEDPGQDAAGQEEVASKQGGENGDPQTEQNKEERWVEIQYSDRYLEELRKYLGRDVQEDDIVKTAIDGETFFYTLQILSGEELQQRFPIQIKVQDQDSDSEESLSEGGDDSDMSELDRGLSHVYDTSGDLIGSGGFGTVYHATHKHTGVTYAIKKMQPKREGDLEKFKEELDIMKDLDHPHIVRLVDTDEGMGTNPMRIVLELGRGGDLFDLLGRLKRIHEKRASRIHNQVLEGVNYLHSNGICHRDLKLENVLLSNPSAKTSSKYSADAEDAKEDFVKIIDFGLAKRFAEKKDGETGQVLCNRERMTEKCGTLEFMSPQVMSKKRKIDPETGLETSEYEGYSEKCDLYSLGVMLFAMLCGRWPTENDSTTAILNFRRKVKQYNKIPQSENGDYIDPGTGVSLGKSKSSKFPFNPAKCAQTLSEEAKDLVIQLLRLEEDDSFIEGRNGEQIPVPGRPDAHAALLLNQEWMLKNGAIDLSSFVDIPSSSFPPSSFADQQQQQAKVKRFSEIPDFTKLIMQRMAAQLPHEQQTRAKEIFRLLDKNSDGTLSLEEFGDFFKKEQEKEQGGVHDSKSFVDTFQKIDTDCSGTLDWTEFLAAFEADSLKDNEDLLKRAFFDFDRNGDMKITGREMMEKLQLMGKNVSKKEIKRMITMFDTNNDGHIDFDECKAALQSSSYFSP